MQHQEICRSVELLTYLENRETYDILILDVYMPVMLGTEVAKELRNRGDQTRIIFLTTSTDHAIDAFAGGGLPTIF